MIAANQFKVGSIFEVNGTAHVVESVVKQTPSARGAGTLYKIRARNVLTRSKTDLTCRGEDAFQQPDFRTCDVQYLYKDRDSCVFMDLESFDQYTLQESDLEEELLYLTEGAEGMTALVIDERVAGIQLPDVVELELVECDPAIKGQTATSRTKPATTETGLVVQVPEYMTQGEVVRIDTRNGKFLSRA